MVSSGNDRRSSSRAARLFWPALAGAAMLLSGCQDDTKTVLATPGTAASWRIVVWGSGDDRDLRIADAIGEELLKRNLAAKIIRDSGSADHVLQVTASPRVFPAEESVRDGRDSRLIEETSFRTNGPTPGIGVDASLDPTRALATTIAVRISQLPRFAPQPVPSTPAK